MTEEQTKENVKRVLRAMGAKWADKPNPAVVSEVAEILGDKVLAELAEVGDQFVERMRKQKLS